MSADANLLREALGPGSGIAVRTSSKYLTRSGIEIVPAGVFVREATVFYKGTKVGRVGADRAGWRYGTRTLTTLPAAVVAAVLDLLDPPTTI